MEVEGLSRAALVSLPPPDAAARAGRGNPRAMPHHSPASPHEMIILQRGRKSLPVTWSPVELRRPPAPRTPPRPNTAGNPRHRQPVRRIPLTPEKTDYSHINTPKKFQLHSPLKSPPKKRLKLEDNVKVVTSLSSTQLLRLTLAEGGESKRATSEVRRRTLAGVEGLLRARLAVRTPKRRTSLRLLELDARARDRLTL